MATNMHISLVAEPVFYAGGFAVTNAMILGLIGLIVTLWICFYVTGKVRRGQYNRFVGLFQWTFESLLGQVYDVIPNRIVARKIAPLAITIFLFILINYWLSIIPGVGTITVGDVPVFRAMVADLNFTFGLAIITVVAVQVYAVRHLGIFGNISRYVRNPLKDPIGAFEGLLELVGEFSRGVSLSLRLFGNAFAGEILLLVAAVLTSYLATVTLPVVMIFELFIGFIQAYVFFILTLIFTALAQEGHGDHGDDHSPATVHTNAQRE